MYTCLAPGAIGVHATTEEAAALATAHGFQSIDLNAGEAAALRDQGRLEELKALYNRHGLSVGAMGLPVQFRQDEETFEKDLAGLDRLASAAAQMGCTRCATWLMPASDERTFEENFELHRRRLGACAQVLAVRGMWLGLEFVGPKTSREGKTHEFVHDLPGILALAGAIDTGNVGVLLDCWHWYHARGTVDDIRHLRAEQVVLVHVNDAPAGIEIDEQMDLVRELPGATGVIDIVGFLQALEAIGYAGPVLVEPFSRALREMPADQAVAVTAKALTDVLAAAGVTPR